MKLLVYGTLKSDHHNNLHLGPEAKLIEKVRVPGYTMYELGWFPGVGENAADEEGILCELWEVPASSRQRLDRYEGYYPNNPAGSLYIRKLCPYVPDAEIYVYQGAVDRCPVVPNGDWQDNRENAG